MLNYINCTAAHVINWDKLLHKFVHYYSQWPFLKCAVHRFQLSERKIPAMPCWGCRKHNPTLTQLLPMFCQMPATINLRSTSWTATQPGVCHQLYTVVFWWNQTHQLTAKCLINEIKSLQTSQTYVHTRKMAWKPLLSAGCQQRFLFGSAGGQLTCCRHMAHTSASYFMYLGLSEEHPLSIPDYSLYTFFPILRVNLLLCERDPVALDLHSETNQTKQRNKVAQLARDPFYW